MSRLTRWKSPTQQSNNTDFRYPPLVSAKTGIRLAKLQPGSGQKAISIELVDGFVTGSTRISYDALSYVWGEYARDRVIFCNGKRLKVTKTLVEALMRFRQPDNEVVLWIDQICICQERLKERNAQVQMMGEIFKAARKVIVWLGDDYDDSRSGLQLANQLLHISKNTTVSGLQVKDLDTHGLPKQGSKRWKALSAILKRPWFWRTWIVQEVVLNPNVELVLGASSFTWDDLKAVVALLEGPLPEIYDIEQAISGFELPFSRIDRIRVRHQKKMPMSAPQSRPVSSREFFNLTHPYNRSAVTRTLSDQSQPFAEPENDDDLLDDPEILDLLLMSRSLGATDPRDKIYGLLGLGKHNIDPDYSMSAESVFTDFALSTIGEATALISSRLKEGLEADSEDREIRKAMILLSCAGKQSQSLNLPSWVPDWTTDILSRPLVFGMGGRYSAGGSQIGTLDWHHDSGLQLSGILFDTVQTAGIVKLESQDVNASHDLIEKWWRECEDIALQRSVRSPGSTGQMDAFVNLRRALGLCRHGYYTGNKHGSQQRRASLLDESELTRSIVEHSALHTMTLGPTRGRVMIVSATGFVGLAPHGLREGDVIFVVLGNDVPFILRQKNEAYELIGEAYIQGIMYGEALQLETALGVQDIMIR